MEVVIKTDFLGADQRTIKLSFKNPVVWCSRYFICFDKAGTTVCCVFRPRPGAMPQTLAKMNQKCCKMLLRVNKKTKKEIEKEAFSWELVRAHNLND